MAEDELGAQLKELQERAAKLQEDVRALRTRDDDATLGERAAGRAAFACALPRSAIRVRRTLRGHTSKVSAAAWTPDGGGVLSAGQDGRLVLWDAAAGARRGAVSLPSSYVMCCAVSPDGTCAASGGLDNAVSVHALPEEEGASRPPRTTLIGHAGFVSSVAYLSSAAEVVSGSGDCTLRLWDAAHSVTLRRFVGHAGDVNALAVLPGEGLLASASADGSLRLWDRRTNGSGCVRVYVGCAGEALCVAVPFLSGRLSGRLVAAGGDDGVVRVFDLAADREVARLAGGPAGMQSAGRAAPVSAVAFSPSGRLLFAAADGAADAPVAAWDVVRGEAAAVLAAHGQRVSSLSVCPGRGCALLSSSWDGTLRLWA